MVIAEITHQISFQAGISYKKFGNFIAIEIRESARNIRIYEVSIF